MKSPISIYCATDVGKSRDHNEDNFVVCYDLSAQDWNFTTDREKKLKSISEAGVLLVVADGMGGESAGEVASHKAINAIKVFFSEKSTYQDNAKDKILKKAILKAHTEIVHEAEQDVSKTGMGTTAVVAWILPEKVYVAWSGDSRCYILRDGYLFGGDRQLEKNYPFTDDHSLVWDLHMQNPKLMTPEDARTHPESNIVTQSLGDPSADPKPSVKALEIIDGDRILLCSDGLNGMLKDDQLVAIMSTDIDTSTVGKELIDEANKAGGEDNITILLADIGTPKIQKGPPPPIVQPTNTKKKTNQVLKGVIAFLVLVILVMAVLLLRDQFISTRSEDGTDSTATQIDTLANKPGQAIETGTSGNVDDLIERIKIINETIDSLENLKDKDVIRLEDLKNLRTSIERKLDTSDDHSAPEGDMIENLVEDLELQIEAYIKDLAGGSAEDDTNENIDITEQEGGTGTAGADANDNTTEDNGTSVGTEDSNDTGTEATDNGQSQDNNNADNALNYSKDQAKLKAQKILDEKYAITGEGRENLKELEQSKILSNEEKKEIEELNNYLDELNTQISEKFELSATKIFVKELKVDNDQQLRKFIDKTLSKLTQYKKRIEQLQRKNLNPTQN
ncbi:MAG: protein phosphatase 2C domain-containing protein [Bacteroidota bacterium]